MTKKHAPTPDTNPSTTPPHLAEGPLEGPQPPPSVSTPPDDASRVDGPKTDEASTSVDRDAQTAVAPADPSPAPLPFEPEEPSDRTFNERPFVVGSVGHCARCGYPLHEVHLGRCARCNHPVS